MVDDDMVKWLGGLDDTMYGKLAAVALVQARTSSTLGAFLEDYLASRSDLKPNSQLVYGHTRRTLVEFFGPEKPLRAITEDDAKRWREYLAGQGLSEATVCKRRANAKVFFRMALKRNLIANDPFSELESRSIANKARQRFISREDSQKVLDACLDAEWRLVFALCRFGGLRCPSEVLALRWSDVDWDKGKMLVRSPKTEHHAGGESRFVPIFPELRPYLMDAFEQAEPGAPHCITRYRRRTHNLRTQFLRILAKAGVKPWPKLFQDLRATRETELVERWPEHVACAWLGNTRLVARKHYLQVTEEHFEQAAQNAAHLDAGAQKPAQYSAGRASIERDVTRQDDSENADLLCGTSAYKSLQDRELGDTGLEPVTR